MIRPINISPIETTNKVYFDCVKCGAKATVTFENRLINADNKYDLKELKNEPCPYCGGLLGVSGLPNLSGPEINIFINKLFNAKGEEFPLGFYMHLLFDEDSPNSRPKKLSERIESLAQFLTKKGGSYTMTDRDRTIVGQIFSSALKYLLREGYINQNEYKEEYSNCMDIVYGRETNKTHAE